MQGFPAAAGGRKSVPQDAPPPSSLPRGHTWTDTASYTSTGQHAHALSYTHTLILLHTYTPTYMNRHTDTDSHCLTHA